MKNKRGIGPLLATVILVAIAITIGAMVSNYMINKAKEFDPSALVEESVYCESVTLGYTAYADDTEDGRFKEITGCPDGSLIGPIYLINRGAFAIHKLIISSPGFELSHPRNILREGDTEPGKIDPSGTYPIMIQINSNLPNKNIKIIPVIKDIEKDDAFVSCVKRQLVIDYTEMCAQVSPPNLEES